MRSHSLGPPSCFHDLLILGQPVWVMCLVCGRTHLLSPSRVTAKVSMLPFNHAVRKFRCNKCTSNRVIILSQDGEVLGR